MTENGDRLPGGFRIALDPGARWAGDGTVLVGGSPIRLLRLTAAGRELVDRWASGDEVPGSAAAQGLARRLLAAGLVHPRPPARDPVSPGEAAVVIPVRNDAGGLAATLAALDQDSARVGAIVVVDDCSDAPLALGSGEATPGLTVARRAQGAATPQPTSERRTTQGGATREPTAERRATRDGAAPGLTVLRRTVQGGPAVARNDGWRATEAPFVAFLDANCEPEPGWLDRLLPHFADPQVAAVAPRISPPAGGRGVMAAYEAVASPLDLGDREAIVRPRSPVAYVPTAALVVRRSALDALGGFDESLTVGEDVDFVWRLAAAGWTTSPAPSCAIPPARPGPGGCGSATGTGRRPRRWPAGTAGRWPRPWCPPGPPGPGPWPRSAGRWSAPPPPGPAPLPWAGGCPPPLQCDWPASVTSGAGWRWPGPSAGPGPRPPSCSP
jgi:GT2 family glycosyltransferase